MKLNLFLKVEEDFNTTEIEAASVSQSKTKT